MFIIGFSNVLEFANKYPGYSSVYIMIDCDCNSGIAENFKNTPTRLFSGSGEGTGTMKSFAKRIVSLGGDATYVYFSGKGHNIFYNDDFFWTGSSLDIMN